MKAENNSNNNIGQKKKKKKKKKPPTFNNLITIASHFQQDASATIRRGEGAWNLKFERET